MGEAPEMTMSSACLKAGQNLLSHLHIRELSPQAEVRFSADVEGTDIFSVGCNAVRALLYSTPYCRLAQVLGSLALFQSLLQNSRDGGSP